MTSKRNNGKGGRSKRITPTPSLPRERKPANSLFVTAATEDYGGSPRSSEVQRRRQMFDEISGVEVPSVSFATATSNDAKQSLDEATSKLSRWFGVGGGAGKAKEHAAHLTSSACNILNELTLLCEAIAGGGKWSEYACSVLEEALPLTLELGPRALEALAESTAVSPGLRSSIKDKLDSLVDLTNYSPWGRKPMELPPMVLPGGETRPLNVMPEEAKRLKNREEARDKFVSILGSLQEFLARNELLNGRNNDYEALHTKVRAFTTTLHIDNIQWFSQLFMERILQTASMGEMDEEVVVLANADPSKMRRLHQRMTLSHVRGKNQRGGTFGIPDYRGSKASENAPGASQRSHHHHHHRVTTQLNGTPGMELVSTVLNNFPTNLRIYMLFLLIADSQRLNEQLESKMLRRLFDIATWLMSSPLPSDVSERLLSCKSLALFVGYFTFCSKDKACVLPEDVLGRLLEASGDDHGRFFLKHPPVLDVCDLIDRSSSQGSLPFTLPWLADYLRFGKYSDNGRNDEVRKALGRLWNIRSALSGENQKVVHSTATLCMRVCLDTLFEEWGINPQDDKVVQFFNGLEGSDAAFAGNLDMANKAMDQKGVQACCPELDDLAAVISRKSLSASHAKKSLRKITPVSPAYAGSSKAVPTTSEANDSMSKLKVALIGREDTKLQGEKALTLQRAMLGRYPELKNVIDFVVDAVARNAVDNVIGTNVREECTRIVHSSDVARCNDEKHKSKCYHSIAMASAGEIKSYVTEKVHTALVVLIPANTDAQVADCAVRIGTEASLTTAAKRLLDRIPIEYQKCVKEKIKGCSDIAKKMLSMSPLPWLSDNVSKDLAGTATRIVETFRVCWLADAQEDGLLKKVQGLAFQLNFGAMRTKAEMFPLLPKVSTYHSLWRSDCSISEALQVLGYIWNDVTFLCHAMDSAGDASGRKDQLFSCIKANLLDQLKFGSEQPNVHFGLGVAAQLADACIFHAEDLLDSAAMHSAQFCTAKLLSFLVGSGSLHPRSLQGILVRLLDEPQRICEYKRGLGPPKLEQLQNFVAKCLQEESLAKDRVHFAQILPKLPLRMMQQESFVA